jgi:hypothetical protein
MRFFLCFLFLTSFNYAFEINYSRFSSSEEITSHPISLEKSAKSYCTNPLKGLSIFDFSARFPASKELADKVNALVKNALGPFGKVVPSSLIVKTDKGDAIDFSKANEQGFLTYEISDVTSLEGEKLGILKATLTLRTPIEITETKEACTS